MTARSVFVVALALSLAAGACTGDDAPPQTAPSESSTRLDASKQKDDGKVEDGERLGKGKQVTTVFEPRLTFTAPGGSEPARVVTQSTRLLLLDVGSGSQVIFARPDEVYTFEGSKPTIAPAPQDLMAWVRSIPLLHETASGTDKDLAGSPPFIEVKVTDPATVGEEVCVIDCVPLIPLGVGKRAAFLVPSQKARFSFVTAGADNMIVLVTGPAPEFKKSLRHASKLLRTVKF
jgi:hypothetical protein